MSTCNISTLLILKNLAPNFLAGFILLKMITPLYNCLSGSSLLFLIRR
ncbi:hypothetical protein NTGM5_610023 [Candidatus Nitrotoga sp. M5]|nr:hypothetical protein NTGM5_610023 [Candidatus Nitrotoga sp. M5]